MCLRCSWFFHERICLRCFMLFFSSECVYAVYGTFTSKYVYAVLCYFFSSECVYAVFGTFTSEYVYAVLCFFSQANVFALFMVLSRANVFSLCLRCLWYLHERICLRCLCYFSRANVFTLFMVLSRANMFIMLFFLTRMCLRWVMCSFSLANTFSLFMASYNMSTLLWCFFFFNQRANNIDAVMWNSYQRICSALLYATFASEYGYAGLWNSFSSYYVRAVMRSYCWCYLCYLRDLGLRDLFLFFVFLVHGLIRLVWQPFQLRLRRWRSKSAQTLWTGR